MSGKVIIIPEGQRTISPKEEYGKQMWRLNNLAEQKRKNPDTKEERYARDYFRKLKLNFVYQYPIIANKNGYIADFYFPDTKTILEIDGSVHNYNERRKADIKRTKDLKSLGYKVIRMDNEDVYKKNYPKEIFNKSKKKVVKSK